MFTMDDILNAKFGVNGNKIDACFKKTVKIKEFETEVIEVRSSAELPDNASGVERLMSLTLLQAQLEYMAYSNLAFKSIVTENELDKRKKQLIADVDAAAKKYQSLTGEDPMDKFIGEHITYETTPNENDVVLESSPASNVQSDSVVPKQLGEIKSETKVESQNTTTEPLGQFRVEMEVNQEIIKEPIQQTVQENIQEFVKQEVESPTQVVEEINKQVEQETVQNTVQQTTQELAQQTVQQVATEPVDNNRRLNELYQQMITQLSPEQKVVFDSWNQYQRQTYFQQYLQYMEQLDRQNKVNNFGNYMNKPV